MAQFEGELAWPERFDTAWDTAMAFELGDNSPHWGIVVHSLLRATT
jgi:hypothetical protein